MPSLFGALLCKIKWQDSVAERASTQQMCFLPKGCWRLPILFPPTRKKKKKRVIVAVFHNAKNKVPTTRGKGTCSGFVKFDNENGKVAFLDEGLNSCI